MNWKRILLAIVFPPILPVYGLLIFWKWNEERKWNKMMVNFRKEKKFEQLEKKCSDLICQRNENYDMIQIYLGSLENQRQQLSTSESQNKVLREALELASKERWQKGCPDKILGQDWFIAMLDNNQRVVLRSLPEEFSYDYTTADDTYYKSNRIKKWMQFLDGTFKTPIDDVLSTTQPQQSSNAIRLSLKPCGDCWLHIDAPSGKKASINLGQRGDINDQTIVGSVIREMAEINQDTAQPQPQKEGDARC